MYRRLAEHEVIRADDELWTDNGAIEIKKRWGWVLAENKLLRISWVGQHVGSRIVRRHIRNDEVSDSIVPMDRPPTPSELRALRYPYGS
jgi:hypothetical protein